MENKQDIMEGLIETHRQVKKQAWNKIKQSLPPSVDLIEQKLGLEISERNKSNYPLQIVKWLDELDELDKQLITNIL